MVLHYVKGDIISLKDNYYLGLVKADNKYKVHIFSIIDAKDMKYERQKYH